MMNDISQVSAEMLLNYLYPEMGGQWIARLAGTFYRNYSHDHIAVYKDSKEVVLARDGFLKVLPEGLLSDENELRGGEVLGKYKRLEQRMHHFREAFLPFDTFSFRQKIKIEQQVSELLDMKLDYLLRTCFHYDRSAETNPYVREMAVLLPYVSKLRADFSSTAKLLGQLLHCKTRLKMGRYSHCDSTRYWIPNVEYQLLIPDLTAEEYRKLSEQLKPLQAFIAEWFTPAEVRSVITIKHHLYPQVTGERLVLDYNTEILRATP